MAEASVTPEASIASVGKGIRYIGNWVYAYSGMFPSAYPSTYLEFTTGSGLIVAEFNLLYFTDAGDNAEYTIKLNDVNVFGAFATSATTPPLGLNHVRIILPPFTKVEGIGSVGSNRTRGFLMTGRVYGAE